MFVKRTVENNTGGAEELAICALRRNGGCGGHDGWLNFTTKIMYRGKVCSKVKRSLVPSQVSNLRIASEVIGQ
jgi:hypothetical protein